MKRIILTLVFVLLLAHSANADKIDINFSKAESILEISGGLGTDYINSRISAIVVKKGTILPSFDDNDYIDGASGVISTGVINIMQTYSDLNGNYSFEPFETENFVGECDIYVSPSNLASPYTATLFLTDTTDVKNFLDTISKAKDISSVVTILEDEKNAPKFGADLTFYNQLPAKEKIKVAEAIYFQASKKAYKYESNYYIDAFENDFLLYTFLAYANANVELINTIINLEDSDMSDKYKTELSRLLSFDLLEQTSTWKDIRTADDSVKYSIASLAADLKVYSPDLLVDALNISLINYKFSKMSGWKDAITILNRYRDVLTKLDYTALNNNKANGTVINKIINKEYTSIDELCEYANSVTKDNSVPGPGSGNPNGRNNDTTNNHVVVVTDNEKTLGNEDGNLFVDLTGVEWAYEAITVLYKKNIISGIGNRLFEPNRKVKREELLKMLIESSMIVEASATCDFSDVNKNDWYYKYIATGLSTGIINGYNDKLFGVGENVTREDMIVIAYRILQARNIKIPFAVNVDVSEFNDWDTVSEYAKESVSYMLESGVIYGRGNGTIAPRENTTRAEAAMFIYNFIKAAGLQ